MAASLESLRTALADRYRIDRELGRGGMATVYRAEDLKHRRYVAVKVLDADLGVAVGRERFLREIEIAAHLQHPHILMLLDSGAVGDLLFYVMPCVEGESLRDLLKRDLQLPVAVAVRIAGQVADALEYAHRHQVIHRDIKPGNILLAGDHTLVADFGIARAVGSAGGPTLTGSGVTVGTTTYMSPEQIGGGPIDGRSDLYGLGCVLFEMLAGEPPFTGPTAEGILHQHLVADPPAITGIRASVPPALALVVQRALSKAAADRYATAAHMARALAAVRLDSTGEETVPLERPQRRQGARPRLALILMTGGLALAMGLGLLTWRARRPMMGGVQALAVLPLANLSSNASEDYFADGMTEELINQIAHIHALRVISRTSAMSLKGTKMSLGDVARALHVDAVVEGTVAREGGRVRISVQLVRAQPERQLWAERYDRDLGDVLGLQADVAQAIAQQIRVRMTPQERSRLAAIRAVDPMAHEAYLRGRYHLSKLDQESYRTAIEAFNTAIRQDAGYAEAWAGLSETYYYISSVYLPSAEAMPRARAAAQKAIELDEGLAQAHASLGVVAAWYDWDWASAEREFRRAIELNPSDAAAHFFLGELLAANQRTTEASREYSRAVELDPLSDYVQATWTQPDYLAGRLEPAIARARRLLQLEPGYFPAHTLLGMCFLQQSKSGEAFSELRRAISLADNPSFPLAILGYGLGIAGRRPEARAVLDTLTLLSARAHVPAYSIAAVYVGLGERDSAFEWLGRSLHDHDEDLAFLAVDPIMKTLRTDARYHELLRAMRLKG